MLMTEGLRSSNLSHDWKPLKKKDSFIWPGMSINWEEDDRKYQALPTLVTDMISNYPEDFLVNAWELAKNIRIPRQEDRNTNIVFKDSCWDDDSIYRVLAAFPTKDFLLESWKWSRSKPKISTIPFPCR